MDGHEETHSINVETEPLVQKDKKEKKNKHKHDHNHNHDHEDIHDSMIENGETPHEAMKKSKAKGKRALIIASIFTLLFMIGEIFGGYIAGSLAIMTDAAHLLTDIAAMLMSLFAMHLGNRPADHRMTFGYHRAEILGALASILTIWVLIGILCYEAILRLKNDAHLVGESVDGRIMTYIGIAGLFVNVIDALILKWGNAPHGHSHSHGSGHENVNVRAAFIHVLGDCIQSLGVIAASVIIWVGNQLTYGSPMQVKSYYNLADPIASLLFGVVTLFTTLNLGKKIVDVLMERVPEGVNYNTILKDLQAIPNIHGVHDLHIWSISIGKVSLSCHIHSDDHVGALVAAQQVCRRHGITHTTIQIDPGYQQSSKCKHAEGVH